MSLRLNSPPTEKVGALENRHTTRLAHPRGTNGSNLVSSRRESSANLTTDDVTGLHSSVSPPTSKLRKNEVRSLVLDTSRSSATLVYRPAGENPAEFVSRLADAVAGSGEELDVDALPHWPEGEPVTLHRQGEVVSLVEILNLANGRLVAHHPDIARDPAMADRVENILRRAAGVIEVAVTSAKAELRVRFNPRVITAVTLIRLVEAELLQPRSTETAPPPGRVNFAPANVSLGVAATGEFVLPIITPVTAAMLVLSNLETFRDTAHQAGEGKFGLPLRVIPRPSRSVLLVDARPDNARRRPRYVLRASFLRGRCRRRPDGRCSDQLQRQA